MEYFVTIKVLWVIIQSVLSIVFRKPLSRSDVILLTGGLGPTYDDLTKEIIAEMLGLPLILHQPSMDKA
ncbi:molybdopterin-binding protein [Erysipelothrix sp. Poltava]|nr:molybdopterin-binding protein [Erysipelothrix sp. Poltava]